MGNMPLRVLLVENTPKRQEILRSLYQDHGWVMAPTAARAIRLLETYHFDLVSLDFKLAGAEQGEDLASFISRSLNGKTKVIVHSTDGKKADLIFARIPQADIVPLSRIKKSHAVLGRFRQELSRGADIDWDFVFEGKEAHPPKPRNPLYSLGTRLFKLFLILGISYYGFFAITIAAHWGLNFCPFHFTLFESSEVIPVVYGYPSPGSLTRALNGKIILGGCRDHFVSGVCPYCKWPASFALFSSAEAALDEFDEEDEDESPEDEPEDMERGIYLEAGIRAPDEGRFFKFHE
jgi:CheY-like chemotaxis protein